MKLTYEVLKILERVFEKLIKQQIDICEMQFGLRNYNQDVKL